MISANRLTVSAGIPDTGYLDLQKSSIRGEPSRQSKAFFTSIGLSVNDGLGHEYNTRKGNSASRRIAVLNSPPPITPRQNGANLSIRIITTMSTLTPVPQPITINRVTPDEAHFLTMVRKLSPAKQAALLAYIPLLDRLMAGGAA